MLWLPGLCFLLQMTGVQATLHIKSFGRPSTASLQESAANGYHYETKYITQKVDHFSFTTDTTFQLRYLINSDWWGLNGAPIFFYTGNEGDITWFCNNTGFMWDIAPQFKALVVFAEHRYYGNSLPFGDKSFKDPAHLGYLTAEQALADFTVLIEHLKQTLPADKSPVVAFGGSYGGMLAAWFRMKYPATIIGALAASAPIWQFQDLVPCNTYSKRTTQDFQESGTKCASNIRQSWDAINQLGSSAPGRAMISKTMRLCSPLQSQADVAVFKDWLSETWGNLAMVDYPYPASFLEPLPAWPIKVVCSHLEGTMTTPEQYISALYQAANVYFNYTGQAKCFNLSQQATGNLGDQGWDYQACTEMVMPMCSDGRMDMFEPSAWNYTERAEECRKTYGISPRPDWIVSQFGGKDIKAASNIIFSNGRLDPWSGGGVMQSITPSLVAIVIHDGAHHLDLRKANKDDPPSVKQARQQEVSIITRWITEFQENQRKISTYENYNVLIKDFQVVIKKNTVVVFGAIVLTTVAVLIALGVTFRKRRQQVETVETEKLMNHPKNIYM